MQSSVAEVSKWIHRKSQPAMSLLGGHRWHQTIFGKGVEQTTRGSSEQTGTMEQFLIAPSWKIGSSQRHRVSSMAETGRRGPDGTTGVEIHILPGPVIDLFRTLTATWERTKVAPTSRSRIRPAALQKPGKPNTIPNPRSIAVTSAWWRLYESAWVQSDSFVKWRHNIGPGHKVAYVKSSEQVAASVNYGWRAPDGGYVAAMDFPQCVRPHGTRIVASTTGRSRMARAPSHSARRCVEGTGGH